MVRAAMRTSSTCAPSPYLLLPSWRFSCVLQSVHLSGAIADKSLCVGPPCVNNGPEVFVGCQRDTIQLPPFLPHNHQGSFGMVADGESTAHCMVGWVRPLNFYQVEFMLSAYTFRSHTLQPNVVTSTGDLPCGIPTGPSPTRLRGRTHATTTGRWHLSSAKQYFIFLSSRILRHVCVPCTILPLMNAILLPLFGFLVVRSPPPIPVFRWSGVPCGPLEIPLKLFQNHIMRSL